MNNFIRNIIFGLVGMLTVWLFSPQFCRAEAPPFSVAFFYAANPPLDELQAFDVVVVDPDVSGVSPEHHKNGHSRLFAYVSAGEADPGRQYFKKIQPEWLIADNTTWGTRVVDTSNPAWQDFFLNQVVEPLWKAGYRGFFLDTLDSWQLVQDKQRLPQLKAGLVKVIKAIKARHPEARLILNRGFEIIDQVRDLTMAVAAESLFRNFNPASGLYGTVSEQDRNWLLERLNSVKKSGLPVIAIDYVNPAERELARSTAEQIRKLGFIPWVSDRRLASLGVGSIEVLPATILGIFEHTDQGTPPNPVYDHLHRYAAMPLEYLGYRMEYHNISEALPEGVLAGRYAGVVVWPASGGSVSHRDYRKWIEKVLDEKLPLVFLDGFGVEADREWLALLGLKWNRGGGLGGKLSVVAKDAMIGFEQPFPAASEKVPRLDAVNARSLLRVRDSQGRESDLAAITAWGGYVLAPAVKAPELDNQTAWIIDPFRFFSQALRLPAERPAADATSENGARLFLAHIDGDGYESMAEWPGGRLAATELREKILERYRLPTSLALIAGIINPKGLNPGRSAELEDEARKLLALSHVEAASHSYSHPFDWYNAENTTREFGYNLTIPGYRFSLKGEIQDSISYLNSLLPAGRKVTLFHWTGNCLPTSEAVRESYLAGVGNINGGETLISNSRPSLTSVAPLGIATEGGLQVFAPNQNENVYTNNWSGPFYGYRRVIETFRLTDAPRRLKPVNIYYHIYAVSKTASLKALQEAYEWALRQQLFPVYPSSYVARVQDFYRTAVARRDGGWLIRNSGSLRQVRLPRAAGFPDLINSRGVLGFSDHNDQRYLHLAAGGDVFLKMTPQPPTAPFIALAAARIESFRANGSSIALTAASEADGYLRFGNASNCRVSSHGSPLPSRPEGSDLYLSLTPGKHELELACQ